MCAIGNAVDQRFKQFVAAAAANNDDTTTAFGRAGTARPVTPAQPSWSSMHDQARIGRSRTKIRTDKLTSRRLCLPAVRPSGVLSRQVERRVVVRYTRAAEEIGAKLGDRRAPAAQIHQQAAVFIDR